MNIIFIEVKNISDWGECHRWLHVSINVSSMSKLVFDILLPTLRISFNYYTHSLATFFSCKFVQTHTPVCTTSPLSLAQGDVSSTNSSRFILNLSPSAPSSSSLFSSTIALNSCTTPSIFTLTVAQQRRPLPSKIAY